MRIDDIVELAAALGLGTGTGAIITAVINTKSSKGKSRAEAADLLVSAAERIGKLNKDLSEELENIKTTNRNFQLGVMGFLAGDVTREELAEMLVKLRL